MVTKWSRAVLPRNRHSQNAMLVEDVALYKDAFPDDTEIGDFVERVEKAVIDPDEIGKLGKDSLRATLRGSPFGLPSALRDCCQTSLLPPRLET